MISDAEGVGSAFYQFTRIAQKRRRRPVEKKLPGSANPPLERAGKILLVFKILKEL